MDYFLKVRNDGVLTVVDLVRENLDGSDRVYADVDRSLAVVVNHNRVLDGNRDGVLATFDSERPVTSIRDVVLDITVSII